MNQVQKLKQQLEASFVGLNRASTKRALTSSHEAGFTLVELMVVVAIIGVLAALAVPQYQSFQAKARQSEARLILGAIHKAEQAYVVSSQTFSSCLTGLGVEFNANSFYAAGFADSSGNSLCGPAGSAACNRHFASDTDTTGATCTSANAGTATYTQFMPAARAVAGQAVTGVQAVTGTTFTVGDRATFTAQAAGRISRSGNTVDVWAINQAGTITNPQPGIN